MSPGIESRARLTAGLLICVNLGIAAYAFTQRFGYAEVLLLYWAETVVIGVLNIPKLLIVALFAQRVETLDDLRVAGSRVALVLLVLLLYVTVFALVWMLLFVAITALPPLLQHADRAAGFVVPRGPRQDEFAIGLAIAVLALSHGISFVVNFLFGREFRGGSLVRIAVQPVLRTVMIIGVMALALVVAFVQPALSRSTAFALVIIGAKTAVDLQAHLAERKRFRQAASAQPSDAVRGFAT